MALPPDIEAAVVALLGGVIHRAAAVGGGCIAQATRLDTEAGPFFLKYGGPAVARTFPAEAAGLRVLHEAGSPLTIPRVLAAQGADPGKPGFLLMTWIEPGVHRDGFWETFGQGLASLHGHTAAQYGFDANNFIGRLPQRNTWEVAWPSFFRDHRLEPQVARARTAGRWQAAWNRPLDALYRHLDVLLPPAPPASLLHGDLWSGNFMVTQAGQAALIDPAVYYGDREADLAMTELFGGFAARFYESYRAAWPLEAGYEARREVYNLYHRLNHLNLFGSNYAGSVASVLRRYA